MKIDKSRRCLAKTSGACSKRYTCTCSRSGCRRSLDMVSNVLVMSPWNMHMASNGLFWLLSSFGARVERSTAGVNPHILTPPTPSVNCCTLVFIVGISVRFARTLCLLFRCVKNDFKSVQRHGNQIHETSVEDPVHPIHSKQYSSPGAPPLRRKMKESTQKLLSFSK